MSSPKSFQPDLIVEVTTVCDRQCAGCYAPNVVTREQPKDLYVKNPEWYLSPTQLCVALDSLPSLKNSSHVISLRGGEPSRHPELFKLLEVLKSRSEGSLFLETHARWLMPDSFIEPALIRVLSETETTVKISFDRMHGLNRMELKQITSRLDSLGISWCVAITEKSQIEYESTRLLCEWIGDEKFIFQPKVSFKDQLVRPQIGVIHVNGSISGRVTSKIEFEPKSVSTLGFTAEAAI